MSKSRTIIVAIFYFFFIFVFIPSSIAAEKKDLHFVTGASIMRIYPMASLAPESASVMKDGITWYDAYNSALQISGNDSIQIFIRVN